MWTAVDFEILEIKTISSQPDSYNAWPTLGLRKSGELWVVYSGGREYHCCPFGQVHAMVSRGGGRTWRDPEPMWYGFPPHLLRLKDGRLLSTYGHRRKPFGNQVRISTDNGRTWGDPMIISGDEKQVDLGYGRSSWPMVH